jgi:hypothetical protein
VDRLRDLVGVKPARSNGVHDDGTGKRKGVKAAKVAKVAKVAPVAPVAPEPAADAQE